MSTTKEKTTLKDLSFDFNTSIQNVSTEWDVIAGKEIFLSTRYLSALEEFPPSNFEFRYCQVYEANALIGIVYFQIRSLALDEFFQEHDHGFNRLEKLRNFVFSKIRHQLLICGNVLLTGPYAYKFMDHISEQNESMILEQCFERIKKAYAKSSKTKIKSVLIKDFDKDSSAMSCFEDGFTKFEVQPSMSMQIPLEWNSFDDYLGAIKSKYKVRYKRAKKKFTSLRIVKFSCDDLIRHNDKMYALFSTTANKADFSLFTMHPNYFGGLHKYLGEDMNTYGIYEEDNLIAFYTLIKNGEEAEAHFLGYDMAKNKQYQLYHNMLFEMVKSSIEMKVSVLNLSRTALEIKSSIGAKPKGLELLVKYDGKIINGQMPKILKLTIPEKKWEERNPFKDA